MSEATAGPGGGHDVPPHRNPYGARHEAMGAPDLDASAPYLSSTEVQRLNRKALLFLSGLVVLLLVTAVLIFNSAMSDKPVATPARVQQQLVIPEAPALPDLPPERTVPVAMEPELPPLPVVQDTPAAASASDPTWPVGSGAPSLLDRRRIDVTGIHGGGDVATGPGRVTPEEYARIMSMESGPPASPPLPAASGASRRSTAQPLYNPDTLLLRGTYIRCILESRIITDVPGFTSCIVTEPVYSVNGRKLLLPRGSKVMGRYQSDAIVGRRAAVVWDRITTPNGLDVNMSSPGVDMLGSAGNEGHYSAHWGQRISSALMISMLSDAFKYAGAKHGPQSTAFTDGVAVQNPYESNTARTLERMANIALERNMARPPTVTINQGTMINVYVAQDVDFAAVLR
ncbi:type IV secretion system protein VirB10 [Luteimonas sp. J16]|jgi:type IV secretion system protein VirB10|uniref:TrbI/VirB10 family protein n=1 Tax=unclassified Luteimonas TaxID=2629088 RepID=UPI000688EAF4|nr:MULTISPECIES: TrbI/VirB10 family protein [unclassified Luteimonas]TWG94320.1 type IV secretion system protein VirB10 [Luteimonas sp. J16]